MLCFIVWIEITLVLCRGIEIDFISEWGIELDLIWVLGRKLLDLCVGGQLPICFRVSGRNWLNFNVCDRTWLNFSVGIGIARFCVRAENLSVLVRASILTFGPMWVVEIDLISVWVSNLTWFQCRNGIELVVVWMVEIELISVYGSELIWFLCRGWKILGFSVWIELTWFLCRGIGADLLLEWGSNWLDVIGGVEINQIFLCGATNWMWVCLAFGSE